MDELLAWLLFFGKLYKLLSPKLEEWERKRDQFKK